VPFDCAFATCATLRLAINPAIAVAKTKNAMVCLCSFYTIVGNSKFMLKSVIVGLTASVLVAITATTLVASFHTMGEIISTAAAQQNTTTAISSPNMNTTFYLFTAEHDGVNLTKTGIESDAYSPDSIIVNRGDIVVIHFYNVDATDRHTFTLGTPYNVNVDLAAGKHSIFSFKANNEGVFGFFCKYHPAMIGHLVVLPPLSTA
jgi:plastocyanin